MLVTRDVSNDARSRDSRKEQPRNMDSMFVTRDVSDDDKSRDLREAQPENISYMLVTRGGVEGRQVKRLERGAAGEHEEHIRRRGGVQVREVNRLELVATSKQSVAVTRAAPDPWLENALLNCAAEALPPIVIIIGIAQHAARTLLELHRQQAIGIEHTQARAALVSGASGLLGRLPGIGSRDARLDLLVAVAIGG